MAIESNCIGFVLSRLGIIEEDRYFPPDYYARLITLRFREVGSISQADALAVVVSEEPHLVIHMMAVDRANPLTVTHRPTVPAEVITESLYRALGYYARGLIEGELRIAKLALFPPPEE